MATDSGMKVVSMERTDAEKKAAEERYKAMPVGNGPDFPWGLCLQLGKDELAKLGIKSLPAIGTEFHIYASAEVTRVSQSADKNQSEDTMSVELQITAMGVAPEDEGDGDSLQSNAAQKLYGKTEKAEGEK